MKGLPEIAARLSGSRVAVAPGLTRLPNSCRRRFREESVSVPPRPRSPLRVVGDDKGPVLDCIGGRSSACRTADVPNYRNGWEGDISSNGCSDYQSVDQTLIRLGSRSSSAQILTVRVPTCSLSSPMTSPSTVSIRRLPPFELSTCETSYFAS